MTLSESITKLEKDIKMAKNNEFMKNYYLEAGDILFKYYDGIENVETTKIDASPRDGGILSYLSMDESQTTNMEQQEIKSEHDSDYFGNGVLSREDLRHLYLDKVDIKSPIPKKVPLNSK